jgi:AcrR family transcriptional regulator
MSASRSGRTPQRSAVAHQRIVEGAVRRFAGSIPSEVSLSDIAAEAGVSKALIVYHFGGRDSLIAAVADRLSDAITMRERAALSESALAVDALWRWLESELSRGDIRVLLSLTDMGNAVVHAANARAATRRRASATETTARLFETLGLRPRVPAALLADVVVAFIDGLALDASRDPAAQRVAFDVFWLAMLNLTE